MTMMQSLPWIFFGIAALGIIFVCVFERRAKGTARPFLSAVLRLGAALAFAFLLRNYFSASFHTRVSQNKAVLLRDVSASMDLFSPETRDAVERMEDKVRTFLEKHSGSVVMTFASNVSAKPGKNVTALGEAVRRANELFPGAALLLLSDGISNTGISPLSAARTVRASGMKIYPVFPRISEAGAVADLALSDSAVRIDPLLRTSVAFCRVSGGDSQDGPDGRPCVLRVFADGKEVLKHEFHLSGTDAFLRIPFPENFRAETGWHEFEFVLESTLPEAFLFNNREKGVFEIPPDTLVLGIYAGKTPDYSALLPVLKARYSQAVFTAESDFRKLTAEQKDHLIRSTSLLFLWDVDPLSLPSDAIRNFAERLKKGETSLIFPTPGGAEKFASAALTAPLLPLRFQGEAINSRRKFLLEPSAPELKDIAFPVWNYTPALPADNAKVLFMARSPEGGILPAMFTRGNVSVPLFSGTWRWKISPDRKTAVRYADFWNRILDKTDHYGESGFRLTAEPASSAEGGDLYRFTVVSFEPEVRAEHAELIWNPPGGGESVHALPVFSGTETEVILPVSDPGIHWFRAVVRTEDKTWRSNRFPVKKTSRSLELNPPWNTDAALDKLADRSGGVRIDESNIDSLEQIVDLSGGHTYEFTPVRDPSAEHYRILCALIALAFLSAEWIYRKQTRVSS